MEGRTEAEASRDVFKRAVAGRKQAASAVKPLLEHILPRGKSRMQLESAAKMRIGHAESSGESFDVDRFAEMRGEVLLSFSDCAYEA